MINEVITMRMCLLTTPLKMLLTTSVMSLKTQGATTPAWVGAKVILIALKSAAVKSEWFSRIGGLKIYKEAR